MWASCILSNLINKILFPVCPVWAVEHFSPLVFRQLPKCNRYQGNRLEGRPGRIAFNCKSLTPVPANTSATQLHTHTYIHNKQSTQSHFCCQFVLILWKLVQLALSEYWALSIIGQRGSTVVWEAGRQKEGREHANLTVKYRISWPAQGILEVSLWIWILQIFFNKTGKIKQWSLNSEAWCRRVGGRGEKVSFLKLVNIHLALSDTTQEDLHSVTFIVRGIITEHRRTAQVCRGLFKTLLLTNSHTMYINIWGLQTAYLPEKLIHGI